MTIRFNKLPLALAAGLLTLGTLSCSDKRLNPLPQTQFSDQVVFDTPVRIAQQANALYAYTKAGGFLGGRVQVFGDIRANDFINRTSNAVTGLTVWNNTLTEQSQNDVINTWGFGYAAINQINVFLAGLDANASKFVAPVFPANYGATALNYQAEARLLRALCYYHLLQFYARPYADGNGGKPGLPLRLKAETNRENNALARSTVDQVYQQILADLNFAEQNLPLTYSSTTLNVTRAHRNTAIALKSRVYLTMGRWADVITEANKLVPAAAPFVASSGVPHALLPSVANVFALPQETTEHILAFPFTAQDPPGTQNQLAFYYLPSSLGGNGEYRLNTEPGSLVADTRWAATDARRTSFVATVGTESYWRKFSTGTPYTDKAPVMRYAEVLLNLAEARVRSTNSVDPQALALLNAVRGRSGGGTYTAASFASVGALTDAILLERRIEFLGEGLRNTDLLRLLQPIPAKSSVGATDPNSGLYIWPIPNTELAANGLMTRN
jgi:hypothetical protein